MPRFLRDGLTLHYRLHGAGPPLLLIHGLGSSGDDWAFQLGALGAARTLILPDLRGSGLSDKPRGPYAIATFAADLWALLDALAIGSCDLLGFSLGGAVALEMALTQPARVRRLITCNSLPSYRIDHWRKWLEARLQVALVRVLGLRRAARIIARRMFPRPEQAPMAQRVVDVVGANPRHAYLASLHALVGWCALDRLPALRVPMLMISAEHDYTPLAEKRRYAARLGAQWVVIEGSRHGTPFDASDAFNRAVLDFLDAADVAAMAPSPVRYQGSSLPS